jgi:hypothetical protein
MIMPIRNPGFYRDVFLRYVSVHVTRDEKWAMDRDGLIYFGSGYWRGWWLPLRGPGGAVELLNPDYTGLQVAAIELGVAELLHATYDDDRSTLDERQSETI